MKRNFVSMQNGKIKLIRGRLGGENKRTRDEFWGDKAEQERNLCRRQALHEARTESLDFMDNHWPLDCSSKITGIEEVLHGADYESETIERVIEITFKHKEGSQTIITRQQRTNHVHFTTGGRRNQRLDVALNTNGYGRLISACAA
jgi:hypothetical protein